jgi:hypothetical protein
MDLTKKGHTFRQGAEGVTSGLVVVKLESPVVKCSELQSFLVSNTAPVVHTRAVLAQRLVETRFGL